MSSDEDTSICRATIELRLGSKVKSENTDLYKHLDHLSEMYRSACNLCSKLIFEHKLHKTKHVLNDKYLHKFVYRKICDAHPELPTNYVTATYKRVITSYKAIKTQIETKKRLLANSKLHPSRRQKLKKTLHKLENTYPKFSSASIDVTVKQLYTFRYLKGYFSLSVNSFMKRIRPTYRICDYYRSQYLDKYDFKVCDSTLVKKCGRWIFNLVIKYPRSTRDVENKHAVIGVDLGINNTATMYNKVTNKYRIVDGTMLKAYTDKLREIRAQLQAQGTRSAMRKLRKLNARSCARMKNSLHVLANDIVTDAIHAGCSGIVMEDLKHIRDTAIHQKTYNYMFHGWAFDVLQTYVTYKARKMNIDVHIVDSAYTSRTCSRCRSETRNTSRVRDNFTCFDCGYRAHADANAAKNIALSYTESVKLSLFEALPLYLRKKFNNNKHLAR